MYMDFGRRKQFPVRNDSAQTWSLISPAPAPSKEEEELNFSLKDAVGQGSSPQVESKAAATEGVPDWVKALQQNLEATLTSKIEAALGARAEAPAASKSAQAAAPKAAPTAKPKTKATKGGPHKSHVAAKKVGRPNKSYYQKLQKERESIEKSRARRAAHDAKRLEAKRNWNKQSKVKVQSRELADTWVAVDNGKPPFGNYGSGNTTNVDKSTFGGGFMLSQNASPQKRPNSPKKRQVIGAVMTALQEGTRYRVGTGQKSGFHDQCSEAPFANQLSPYSNFQNLLAPDFPAVQEEKAPNSANAATTSGTKVDLEALLRKEQELLAREKLLLERELAASGPSEAQQAPRAAQAPQATQAAAAPSQPVCRQAWGVSRNLNSCPAVFQWPNGEAPAVGRKEALQPAARTNLKNCQHVDLAWGNNPTAGHQRLRAGLC